MFASVHGSGDLRRLAFEFSPTVEQSAADTVTLDASGLDRLFGLPQDVAAAMARRASELGLKVSIALASNPDAAICAARGFRGVSVMPYGDEAKFLGTLPLALLSPSEELAETLERWGIRFFQDLAGLPPLGIAERLGAEGLKLRELARGEAERKLLAVEDPLKFEDEVELDYPVELLEPLAFLLARLMNGLATRLTTRALATDELRLRLSLEDRSTHERTLRLPVPSLDTKAFLKLWQLDLAANPPSAPVVKVWMAANPAKPQAAQTGLYVPVNPEPVKLELTLARIRAIVGASRVGRPQLIDSHRPGAFRMLESAGEGARSRTRVELPRARLVLRMAGGIRGKVLEFAGPWRTAGDWWTNDPWSSDEWDIALSDGALYLLCCNALGWFVEGSYD